MADGKQWYNSPEQPDKKNKAGGKTGNPAGRTSPARSNGTSNKPGAKPSGKPVGAQAGRPSGVKTGKPSGNVQGRNVKTVNGNAKSQFGKKAPVQKKAASINLSKKQPVSAETPVKPEKSIIPQMDKIEQSSDKKQIKPDQKAVSREKARIASQTANKEKNIKSKRDLAAEKEKRQEEARIKEQKKIEKREHDRKHLGMKTAESRAVRNGFLGALIVAAALFVLAFVIRHLYDFIAEKPNFSFVTTGTVEHTIGAKALIVRDEDVIKCSNAGELVTQITEGSRVAKDQKLAIVVPDEMRSVVLDLRNVQSQISDVQQELILTGSVAEADTIYTNYNKNLSAILDSVRFDAMSGNLTNMSSYGSSVNVILDEREDEMSRINFDDERITVLRSDEKVYEAQVEKYASVITAHRPGIVSFRLDGKEELLNYKMFLAMPAADVKAYINNSVGAITSDLTVEQDAPVARIAQNESQYLSVYLSANDAAVSDFAEGTLHDINVRTEGISIDNCKVVRCESDASGMLITFETSRYVEGLLDLRTVDIEIVIAETNGMRVSVPSLVDPEFTKRGSPAFCVYFAPAEAVNVESFAPDSIFNLTVTPVTMGEDGTPLYENPEDIPVNTSVGGCTVIRSEAFENGGVLVAFATPNDFANLKRLDRTYSKGYTASFVDTATGLGITCKKIMVSDYSGMASVYTNNQGFVEEIRVIILDNDREFAIIDQVGDSSVPNLDTVIITNPKTVKPGKKVD